MQKQFFRKIVNDGLSKTLVGALPAYGTWVHKSSPLVVFTFGIDGNTLKHVFLLAVINVGKS